MFISSALTGTSTDPVIRNSSTNVREHDHRDRATAAARPATPEKSISDARRRRSPSSGTAGRCARSRVHQRLAASPCDGPAGVMSTDAYGESPSRPRRATADHVRPVHAAQPGDYASSWAGVARASTVTGSVRRRGSGRQVVAAPARSRTIRGSSVAPGRSPACSDEQRRAGGEQQRGRADRDRPGAALHRGGPAGRRTPRSPVPSAAADRGSAPPASASSAGTSVSAASSATTTTATPGRADGPEGRVVEDHQRRTARPRRSAREKAIVRPAVAAVRSTASGHASPAPRSSRNRLTISSA